MIPKATLLLLLSLLLSSCAGVKEINTAQGLYEAGVKASQAGYITEALNHFKKLKSQFPYSKFSIQADLAIADTFYSKEAFVEAEAAYKVFKDLHPKRRPNYTTFRLAMSIYKQIPSTIDRDISLAPKAMAYFDEVIKAHPKSPFKKEALIKKNEILKKLVKKELYIANFYLKRNSYKSSLGRFEKVLQKYPNTGFNSKALYGAAISAHKLANKKKAQQYLSTLKKNHSNTDEYKKAKKIILKK